MGTTDNTDLAMPDLFADMDPYYLALGKLVVSWNGLQDALALLFAAVFEPHAKRVPLAVWNSTNSDRAQKEMLRAAADAYFTYEENAEAFPAAKGDIAWLVTEAIKLEDDRNTSLHSPLAVSIVDGELGMVPWTVTRHPRALRLEGKNLLDQFDWHRRRAEALKGFAHQLHYQISFRGNPSAAATTPWPERPLLPSLQKMPKKAKEKPQTKSE